MLRAADSAVRNLSWPGIALAGAAAGCLTIVLVYEVVLAYAAFYPLISGSEPPRERLASFASFASSWGSRAIFFFLVAAFAFLLVKWVAKATNAHGLLVGFAAALVLQGIHLIAYRPIIPMEAAIYISVGLPAGLAGAAWARRALADQEAFDRATRKIAEAEGPEDIAAAFGLLAAPSKLASVTLWKALPTPPSGATAASPRFELWSSWPPAEKSPWEDTCLWPRGSRLTEGEILPLSDLAEGGPTAVLPRELGEDHRAKWSERGIRAAYLVPVLRSGGDLRGLVVVTLSARPSGTDVVPRAYRNVAAHAATALENMLAGMRIGALEERQRFAQDVHDSLAQTFSGLVMQLEALGEEASSEDVWRRVETALSAAREGRDEARRLLAAQRPRQLDGRELPEALRRLATTWARETGVEATVQTHGTPRVLPPDAETALYRIAQEALANVRKHAHAKTVKLALSFIPGRVVLDVRDDGRGFESGEVERHSSASSEQKGLAGMRWRAENLGGSMFQASAPGKGTRIFAEVPTDEEETRNGAETGSRNLAGRG